MTEVTRILSAIEQGEPRAAEQLLPLLYDELRSLAARKLAREKPGQTLDATALVHEAYLRLVGDDPDKSWHGQRHFFAAAAEAMRRILVEQARRKGRRKRGGARRRLDLQENVPTVEGPDIDTLAVHAALTQLAGVDPEKAELVKLRYFAGLTLPQAADVLGISTPTAERLWRYARAWLARELGREEDRGED
jgi:RNA polymerase sigma factor (TIGR02999 family)